MGLLMLMGSTDFNPRAELFANGEQGLVADISPQTTLWQDSGKTTRATSPGDPVGYIEDSSGRGNNVTQASSGSRPILSRVPFGGRRNLLNESERFDQTYWSKSQSTVTANAVANPVNGEITADKLVDNATTNIHQVSRAVSGIASGGTYTFSFLAKSAELSSLQVNASGPFTVEPRANITLTGDGTATVAQGDAGTATDIVNLGDGWYECSFTFVTNAATDVTVAIRLVNSSAFYLGNGTDGLYLFGAQFEAGSSRTNYQRTAIAGTVVDCVEQGVPDCWYLDTSSNKWMQTAAIDFTGTDEMTVIAGIRKLSDAASAAIAELTASVSANNGAFALFAPSGSAAKNAFGSRGSTTVFAETSTASTFAAPLSAVHTGLADISSPSVLYRQNGVEYASSVSSQGSGNYSNSILYVGSRAGASAFFNGHLFSFIIRGKTTSGSKLTRAEKYIAKKTGLTI